MTAIAIATATPNSAAKDGFPPILWKNTRSRVQNSVA